MKVLVRLATTVLLLHALAAFVQPQQPAVSAIAIRRIQVNASSITSLAKGKKYVVNLTQRGVKYEFDHKAGKIDFNRITIRTANGNLTLASFLQKNFSKEQLAGFNVNSHSFTLGTRLPDTVPPVDQDKQEARLSFSCGSLSCDCVGDQDCGDLIFRSRRCRSMIFCWIGDDGKTHCHCRQHE